MNLNIEKTHKRKQKLSWRAVGFAFGGFGIYVLIRGLRNIQDEKLILGFSGLIAGLVGIYSLVSAVYGKDFLKRKDVFRLNDSKLEFKDTSKRKREIKIQDLKDIIISKSGLKVQFITKNLKVIESDLFHFSESERAQIIESLNREKRLLKLETTNL